MKERTQYITVLPSTIPCKGTGQEKKGEEEESSTRAVYPQRKEMGRGKKGKRWLSLFLSSSEQGGGQSREKEKGGRRGKGRKVSTPPMLVGEGKSPTFPRSGASINSRKWHDRDERKGGKEKKKVLGCADRGGKEGREKKDCLRPPPLMASKPAKKIEAPERGEGGGENKASSPCLCGQAEKKKKKFA